MYCVGVVCLFAVLTPFLGKIVSYSQRIHLKLLQIDPKPCTPRGMQPERTRPKEGWVRGWAGLGGAASPRVPQPQQEGSMCL